MLSSFFLNKLSLELHLRITDYWCTRLGRLGWDPLSTSQRHYNVGQTSKSLQLSTSIEIQSSTPFIWQWKECLMYQQGGGVIKQWGEVHSRSSWTTRESCRVALGRSCFQCLPTVSSAFRMRSSWAMKVPIIFHISTFWASSSLACLNVHCFTSIASALHFDSLHTRRQQSYEYSPQTSFSDFIKAFHYRGRCHNVFQIWNRRGLLSAWSVFVSKSHLHVTSIARFKSLK